MSKRSSFFKALGKPEVPEFDPTQPWSQQPPPDFGDPGFIEQRQQQEAARQQADANWLAQRGIKTRQEMQPDLSMQNVHEPMNIFGMMAEGGPQNVQSLKKIGANLFEDIATQPQNLVDLLAGDVPIRDKRGRVVDRRPFERERFTPELTPIEESQADLANILYDVVEPGPGGEARFFFGTPAQKARQLHALDWARKNLRGPARTEYLRSLEDAILLGESGVKSLGSHTAFRGQGALYPPGLMKEIDQLAAEAIEEGPEAAAKFAQEKVRLDRFMMNKKQRILKEYEDLAGQGVEVPLGRAVTPAQPSQVVRGREAGPHPLSNVLHENEHIMQAGRHRGRLEEGYRAVEASPMYEQLIEQNYPEHYAARPQEQQAFLVQGIGSGEISPFAPEMQPVLEHLKTGGWNVEGLSGAFPKTKGGSGLEREILQPAIDRARRWRERSFHTKEGVKKAESTLRELRNYVEFIAAEGWAPWNTPVMAEKMKRR